MRFLPIIAIAGACLGGAVSVTSAGPARFWISDSWDNPTIPEAPQIDAAVGQPRKLFIWAQPATDAIGDFRTLENFSLDVVTLLEAPNVPQPQPFVDFLDGTFKVYNDPVVGTDKRFQLTTDSSRSAAQGGPLTSEKTAAQVVAGSPDEIEGLQGLSPFLTPAVVGLGHVNDPHRVVTSNGPAWRIAEFSFRALRSSGTNNLFLQIGHAGMTHNGVGDTELWFGTDNTSTTKYNATISPTVYRQKTLAGDTFDVQINAVEFTPGDFDGDGNIGADDYDGWRSSFGQSVGIPGEGADGNSDGVVDAADYVFWRKQMDQSAASASAASNSADGMQRIIVPEPGTDMLIAILVAMMLLAARVGHRDGLPRAIR